MTVAHWFLCAFLCALLCACGGRSGSPTRDDAGTPQAPEAAAPIDACVSGAPCAPAGNPCQTGVFSCSAGTATCTAAGFVANGTACGSDRVCLAGACAACAAGGACSPAGNPCQTGTTACTTGQPTCVPTGDVPNGQSCDAGVCCGGLCAACSTPDHATAVCSANACAVACNPGYSLCGSRCADTTSDNSACGPACNVCPTGSTCKNSACSSVARYGNLVAFSPCNTSNSVEDFGPGLLIVQKVTIQTSLTVTDLGVIGNQGGAHGILVLYSDSGGAPSALEAQTASTSISAGDNPIAVTHVVTIPAGTYWVGGEYDGTSSLCVDSSQVNLLDYVSVSSYGTVPDPFGTARGSASVDVNYYVVGVQ